jgi:hypothetical protein
MIATVEKVYKGKVVVTASQTVTDINELLVFLSKMQYSVSLKEALEDLGRLNVVYRTTMEQVNVQDS